MAAIDLVPCFYTGQNCAVENPAKFEVRSRCHELKKAKLGKFVENGKYFLFEKTAETVVRITNFPVSVKSRLRFMKTRTDGDKLHYEIPMAGDRTPYLRSFGRNIRPSKRVADEVAIAQMSAAFNWRVKTRQAIA